MSDVTMPKWQWALIGTVVGAVIYGSVQLTMVRGHAEQIAGDLDEGMAIVRENAQEIRAVREEQLKRTNPVYAVGDLRTEIDELEKRVTKLEVSRE